MRRQVFITGVGPVCALGCGREPVWQGLASGRSGLAPLSRVDPGAFLCRFAGEIPGLSARDVVPRSYRKSVKVMARDIEIAVAAAHFAVSDAGLVTREHAESGAPPTYPPQRLACQVGAGLVAAQLEELAPAFAAACEVPGEAPTFSMRRFGSAGLERLQPLWMLKYLPNMLACHVTIIHGCEGPSNTITCGEASGLLSIGESARVIERDGADAALSGSAESKVNPMGLMRYELAGRLADVGDLADPAAAVRAYDPAAPGTILGEGGGIVVLEESRAAARRGARPFAEVAGFGAAAAPVPAWGAPAASTDDEGLVWAIECALADAGIEPRDIDAIVPHACACAEADAAEAGALRRVFGERLARIPLVLLCPSVGSCIAGHGGLAAAVGAVLLREQHLPARINAGAPASGLDAAAAEARNASLQHVLVIATSLGGQSAAIILRHAGR